MTTLADIFSDLANGELAGTAIVNFDPDEFTAEPDPKRYQQIISHVNLGLTQLYKRFYLRSDEIYVQQYEGMNEYLLHYDFAVSNTASAEPVKYIEDTVAKPFLDNILKIEEVYDEDGGKLFLNDISQEDSLFTPTYRTLQVPTPNEWNILGIQYRGNHPKIVYSRQLDPAATEIELPQSLHQCLLFFIASRVFSNYNLDQGAQATEYYQKYENACQQAEQYGLYIQPETGPWRFEENGWV